MAYGNRSEPLNSTGCCKEEDFVAATLRLTDGNGAYVTSGRCSAGPWVFRAPSGCGP